MKHRDSGLYAMTNSVNFDRFIHGLIGGYDNFIKALDDIYFDVQCVSSNIQIRAINTPTMGKSFFEHYEPIDCKPAYTEESLNNLDEVKIFKPMVRTKEIFVGPQTVSEALDYIQKLQDPKQQEIMENRRKEKSREEVRNVLSGNKQEEFVAQLICIK